MKKYIFPLSCLKSMNAISGTINFYIGEIFNAYYH